MILEVYPLILSTSAFLVKKLERPLWDVQCLLVLMETFVFSLILREPLRVGGP